MKIRYALVGALLASAAFVGGPAHCAADLIAVITPIPRQSLLQGGSRGRRGQGQGARLRRHLARP